MKFAASALFIVTMTFALRGQENIGDLDRRLGSVDYERTGMHLVLSDISERFGLSIGFESANEGDPVKMRQDGFDLKMENPTVREFLDRLTSQTGVYKWQIEDGVINVRPIGSNPSFLDLQIKLFRVKLNKHKGITEELEKQPEIAAVLKRNMLRFNTITSGGLTGESLIESEIIEFKFENVSLRTILNQLAKSRSKYWIF